MPQVMQKKADEIVAQIGADVGLDPMSIIAIITATIQAFLNCRKTPVQAHRDMVSMAKGQWYPGYNLQLIRLRNLLRNSPCCDVLPVEELEAVIKDAAGTLTLKEVKALYEEVQE